MPTRYDHITDALITLHWLCLPERVDFKVAVMAYRALHGLAPPYLSQLARVADLPIRRRLRSSETHQLLVPPFRLSTVGRRSFPVAMATLWNTLPVDVHSSPSLTVFCQRLKTFLFHKSFPDIVWQADYAFMDLVMAYCYFRNVKNFLIDWYGRPGQDKIDMSVHRCLHNEAAQYLANRCVAVSDIAGHQPLVDYA